MKKQIWWLCETAAFFNTLILVSALNAPTPTPTPIQFISFPKNKVVIF